MYVFMKNPDLSVMRSLLQVDAGTDKHIHTVIASSTSANVAVANMLSHFGMTETSSQELFKYSCLFQEMLCVRCVVTKPVTSLAYRSV